MASEECIFLNVELDDFILCNISAAQYANLSLVGEDFFYYKFLYAIPTIYGIIILIGLVGNITLIKIFCSVKSMRNVPNLFISSLAFGDLLLLLTCVPVDASRYLSPEWLFGRVGCKLIPFIQLTSVGVSVFTLTALSADRNVLPAIVCHYCVRRHSIRASSVYVHFFAYLAHLHSETKHKPLRMPAIDVGEMSGENASGTWPDSPEETQ